MSRENLHSAECHVKLRTADWLIFVWKVKIRKVICEIVNS